MRKKRDSDQASEPANRQKAALSPRGRGSTAAPAPDEDALIRVFASNVRRLRQTKNLSQEDLADLADLDRTYVSSIERMRRNVSIRNIQRLAVALNVPPSTLLEPTTDTDA